MMFNPIVLGKLGSAYGIRGWLRVYSSTESAENIFTYQPWFIKKSGSSSDWKMILLESWRPHNRDWIIKIKNIEDRETARLLTNYEIMIDASQLPDLTSGNFYWKDLIGCKVVTISGYHLGKVIALIETGSNDVMVVKANHNDAFGIIQERLIPFIYGPVIKNVDLTTSVMKVDWAYN